MPEGDSDRTYQTLVYHSPRGDDEVIKSGGIIRGHSGGIMSHESGFIYTLASQNVLAKDKCRIEYSWNAPYIIGAAAVSTALSESNVPVNVKYVLLSGTSTLLKGSIWMTSCSAGAELYLRFGGADTSNASTQFDLSCSGCIILGSVGDFVSAISVFLSNSFAMIHFIAPHDNTWAIVDQFGDVNEQAN